MNAVVVASISISLDGGFSMKHQKKRAVSVAFFGDGAPNQGVLYGSMNLEAVWLASRALIGECCFDNLLGPLVRVAAKDIPVPATQLEKLSIPNPEEIAEAASGLV